MSDYTPDNFRDYPHDLYLCPVCDRRDIAIGWEVESVVCGDCKEHMEHYTELWTPRRDNWGRGSGS